MTNEEVVNKIDCFQVDGDESNPVSAQTILPDISAFQLITISEVKNGEKCQKWQKTELIGEKAEWSTDQCSEDFEGAPLLAQKSWRKFPGVSVTKIGHFTKFSFK